MAVRNIKIVDYGICQPDSDTTKDKTANSPTGYFLHSDKIQFLETTDKISAQIGLNFGISYKFETDTKEEELIDFVCKINHPQLTNPQTNERFKETIESKDGWSNELGFDFYSLEFDWELQNGEWTFEIIYEGQIMCRQTFKLNKNDI